MKKLVIFIVTFVLIIIIYGFFINPKDFKLVENQIKIEGLVDSFDGFKIIQISDLLLGSTKFPDDLEEIVNQINEINPDIIVFTGDLFGEEYLPNEDDKNTIKDYLKSLDCSLYKYAVMGDNDQENIETFQEIMKEADFNILDNESTYLFYKDNSPIKITGLTNTDEITKSIAMSEEIETTLNLVLTHFPDNIDAISEYDIDLVLAGHSLKGQIRLPLFGGIMKKDGANNYLDDHYQVGNTLLYVSGGLGTEKIQFRLFNKPEINLYRLSK